MGDAIDLAGRLEYRPGLVRSNFHFAELLYKKGDLDQAREHLGQATAFFHDMEMTWWLAWAETLRERLERGDLSKSVPPYAE